MGTNFYLKGTPACSHCGRGADRSLHIGKSSAGWTFGLRIHRRDGWYGDELRRLGVDEILSLEDWLPLIRKHGAVDEYGDDVPPDEMIRRITERTHPNGLLRRHELGAHMPVTMPPGVTYDLIDGEFS